jgi:hypothetical protein
LAFSTSPARFLPGLPVVSGVERSAQRFRFMINRLQTKMDNGGLTFNALAASCVKNSAVARLRAALA